MKTKGKYWLFWAGLFSVLLTACKKEEIIIPESNDPVFKASGTLNGEPFEIVAGDNGAYMYTMTLEEKGVDVFTGRISDGQFELEMGIYDGHIDQPGHVTVNDLYNFTPQFASDVEVPMLILSRELLSTLPQSQFIETINWQIDGEWIGEDDAIISTPGVYEVCAEIRFFGGFEQQLCNEVIVGYERHGNCSIDFSVMQQGSLIATANSTGSAVQSVRWFLNNEWISDQAELFYNLPADFSVLSAEITLENGVKRIRRVLVNGTHNYLTSNDFSVFESNTPVGVALRDLNFKIIVRQNGITYNSMACDNSNSTIAITQVDYYGLNDQGNPVYKFKGLVDAKVKNMSTQDVVPITFTTSFGVEIK